MRRSFISQRKSNKAKEKKARRLEERAAMDAICAKVDAANKVTFTCSSSFLERWINPISARRSRRRLAARRLTRNPPSLCFQSAASGFLRCADPNRRGSGRFSFVALAWSDRPQLMTPRWLLMRAVGPVIDIHSGIKQIRSHMFLNA